MARGRPPPFGRPTSITRSGRRVGAPTLWLCDSPRRPWSGDVIKERTASEPWRGEAAFRAQKAAIAKRNESARADGAVRRAEREARISEQQVADDRRERRNLPRQPHP